MMEPGTVEEGGGGAAALHVPPPAQSRSSPEVVLVTALGRVAWAFVALEEAVIAILEEFGPRHAIDPRSMEAGGRERALRKLHRDLGYRSVATDVLAELEAATAAFGQARTEYRGALGLAGGFTGHAAGRRSGLEDGEASSSRAVEAATGMRSTADSMQRALEPLQRARRMLRSAHSRHPA